MADAMPEVPEFITPEMQDRFGAEAERAVRSRLQQQDRASPTDEGRSWLDAETVDTIHTVLVGLTIAVVSATAAVGLLFVWLAVPGLAYTLAIVAAACALGWTVYFPMARRVRRRTRR